MGQKCNRYQDTWVSSKLIFSRSYKLSKYHANSMWKAASPCLGSAGARVRNAVGALQMWGDVPAFPSPFITCSLWYLGAEQKLEGSEAWDLQHLYFWVLLLYPVPQLLLSSQLCWKTIHDCIQFISWLKSLTVRIHYYLLQLAPLTALTQWSCVSWILKPVCWYLASSSAPLQPDLLQRPVEAAGTCHNAWVEIPLANLNTLLPLSVEWMGSCYPISLSWFLCPSHLLVAEVSSFAGHD